MMSSWLEIVNNVYVNGKMIGFLH